MGLVDCALTEPDDLTLELTGVLEAFEDDCFPVVVVDASVGELPVAPNPTVPPPPRSEVRPPTMEEMSALFFICGCTLFEVFCHRVYPGGICDGKA